MKKVILILATPLFLFSCNDSDEDTNPDEEVVIETTNVSDDTAVVDYTTMSYSDQEAYFNDRLTTYRSAESQIDDADRDRYRADIDTYEKDLEIYRTKRSEYDQDTENETLKAEIEEMGNSIRANSDNLEKNHRSLGEILKNHHNQKVKDVKDAVGSTEIE